MQSTNSLVVETGELTQYENVPEHTLQYKTEITRLESELKDLNETLLLLNKTRREKLDFYNKIKREALTQDEQVEILRKVFSKSQIRLLMGKKKTYWSADDMAVGYTIRHMSSKRFYMYLTKKLKFPLPALSSVKQWASAKKTNSKINKKELNNEEEEESE